MFETQRELALRASMAHRSNYFIHKHDFDDAQFTMKMSHIALDTAIQAALIAGTAGIGQLIAKSNFVLNLGKGAAEASVVASTTLVEGASGAVGVVRNLAFETAVKNASAMIGRAVAQGLSVLGQRAFAVAGDDDRDFLDTELALSLAVCAVASYAPYAPNGATATEYIKFADTVGKFQKATAIGKGTAKLIRPKIQARSLKIGSILKSSIPPLVVNDVYEDSGAFDADKFEKITIEAGEKTAQEYWHWAWRFGAPAIEKAVHEEWDDKNLYRSGDLSLLAAAGDPAETINRLFGTKLDTNMSLYRERLVSMIRERSVYEFYANVERSLASYERTTGEVIAWVKDLRKWKP